MRACSARCDDPRPRSCTSSTDALHGHTGSLVHGSATGGARRPLATQLAQASMLQLDKHAHNDLSPRSNTCCNSALHVLQCSLLPCTEAAVLRLLDHSAA